MNRRYERAGGKASGGTSKGKSLAMAHEAALIKNITISHAFKKDNNAVTPGDGSIPSILHGGTVIYCYIVNLDL